MLFENLELTRTVAACGGSCTWPLDLFVVRRPPTPRHLLGQRVRQAYDELARPAHLFTSLTVLPAVLTALIRRRPALPTTLGLAAVGAAWLGRRGRAASASTHAPAWRWRRCGRWNARSRSGSHWRTGCAAASPTPTTAWPARPPSPLNSAAGCGVHRDSTG